ncbi:MAG: DUF1217 domain-containing protein [Pseudomonadota bacterium]
MTYQPVVPVGGIAGWAFLQRTRENQQEAFDNSVSISRAVSDFEARIGQISTAEDLVSDRRLLSVALGAFGLSDDIDSRFFIRSVLESDSLDPGSLANRLSDKRYLALSEAFGFGTFDTPRTVLSTFPAEITSRFKEREFEVALGNQSESMRAAAGFGRELASLTEDVQSEEALWFSVMANPALRVVFEGGLALPSSIGSLDVDRQRTLFEDKAAALFGDATVSQFLDPEAQEDLVRRYLAQSEIEAGPSGSVRGSAALALLQASPILPLA